MAKVVITLEDEDRPTDDGLAPVSVIVESDGDLPNPLELTPELVDDCTAAETMALAMLLETHQHAGRSSIHRFGSDGG